MNQKWFYFFFYLVIFLSFHAFVGDHATGINSKSIFFIYAFCCLDLLAPSYKPNMFNSLRITIVKIFIIKYSTIKGILLGPVSLLKNNNIRVYITKDYIIIRKYRMIKFFNILLVTKQSGTNFNACSNKNQHLYHVTFQSSTETLF